MRPLRRLLLVAVFGRAAGLAVNSESPSALQLTHEHQRTKPALDLQKLASTSQEVFRQFPMGEVPGLGFGGVGNFSLVDMMKIAHQAMAAMKNKTFVSTILRELEELSGAVAVMETAERQRVEALLEVDVAGVPQALAALKDFLAGTAETAGECFASFGESLQAMVVSIPNGTLELPSVVTNSTLPNKSTITAGLTGYYMEVFGANDTFSCKKFRDFCRASAGTTLMLRDQVMPLLNSSVPKVEQLQPFIAAMAPDVVNDTMKVLNTSLGTAMSAVGGLERTMRETVEGMAQFALGNFNCSLERASGLRAGPGLLGLTVTAMAAWVFVF